MARPVYQKANQRTGLWLVICFAGLGAEIAFLGWALKRRPALPWGWSLALAIVPFVGGLIFGWVTLARLNRQRISRLAAVSSTLGFQLVPKPTQEQKTAYFAPLAPLADPLTLRYGADRIVWFAEANPAEKSELLFEHEYITGSGKTTQVHTHTVLAWPCSHPAVRAAELGMTSPFSVARHAALLRWSLRKFERTVPHLGELGKKWTVYGDADSAARFLSPAVCEQLRRAPKGEQWYVGHGWVCCLFASNLDDGNLPAFVTHARALLSAATPGRR